MPPMSKHLDTQLCREDIIKDPLPRIIMYYQTHHDSSDNLISALPLAQPGSLVTHVILAAIHINEDPENLTLNDHVPDHPRNNQLWSELALLQASGIKVLGMLGGAARGSYIRLDGSAEQFEKYYGPLRDFVRGKNLDGLDLDVEEVMSLQGIIRLIDRLRSDFGEEFIITFAPVASALLDPTRNLSGFNYADLEAARGKDIAWYNAQFYFGWGDISNTNMYDLMVSVGWNPEKIVIGMLTNPTNGKGFLPWSNFSPVLASIRSKNQRFGGVMGWEYFNSLPGDVHEPWEWAMQMTNLLRK
ncbi:hypothetical protein LPJ78_002158 [Coemansia sp. RSA 989]|nr:alkaline phosphatase [Coemansia mojavensis]KAJ1742891.1 hypothetical protein LPJ68_001486 [Coemansia sp. RSA 1086]KAJ1749423.1 hypothetical protein LPJ79_003751 [Coemansia sp. RSA 1821]KAJ1866062.1 hypothetical protein LPJ78_002158 [Coemansia sp. RSA 989]KAJ1873278.1 hypothetical protein LPJ55_002431 [Coemansia sp. RSA 990]